MHKSARQSDTHDGKSIEMTPATPILSLQAVSKTFPGVRALDNVSFDMVPGEVHALLGENGAGKSTLIKIVSGVHQADEGIMQVNGQTARFSNPNDAQIHGIATIFQELLLYPELSVAENIFMGHAPKTRLGMLDWQRMRRLAREQLASLNIDDLDVDQLVGSLSVGNKQRVEIAKALSQNARLLIMDEPTAALSGSDAQRLFSIVRLLRERGVAIIYISHRLEEVFQLADRVTVLRDGAYVATKKVSDTSEADLINMMVGRTIDDLFPKLPARIGDTVLQLHNVSRPPATHNVSLTLKRGQILGIAGLVGSGRSELAQTIFGITPAHSGKLELDGKPIRIRNPGDAQALGIAYVPEDRGTQGLIRELTIRENVSLVVLKEISGGMLIDRKAEQTLAEESVERFNIRASSTEQICNKLSGGNQQKVVLGKWLASKPRVLIMDEPTRGIDVGAKAEIHRMMSELASEGLAVLMISSELPEVIGMSDTIAVMRDGRIVAQFDRDEASQEQIAAAMMGGVSDVLAVPPGASDQERSESS